MDRDQTEQNDLRFEPFEHEEQAVRTFLVAADTLACSGDHAQAELRYRQALKQAEIAFGPDHEIAKRVLVAMMMYYLGQNRADDAAAIGDRIAQMPKGDAASSAAPGPASPDKVAEENQPINIGLASKLAGKKSFTGVPAIKAKPYVGNMPRDIRKACQILGITDENLSVDVILKAWKMQVVNSSAHPDLGGTTETSVLLNNAKDSLMRWLESRSPKLGKRFENWIPK